MSITFWASGIPSTFELNVTNGNAPIIYALLGVDGTEWAIEDHLLPEKLVRLDLVDPRDHVRWTEIDGNLVNCGAPLPQVEGYVTRMRDLVHFCIAEDTDLVWG